MYVCMYVVYLKLPNPGIVHIQRVGLLQLKKLKVCKKPPQKICPQ